MAEKAKIILSEDELEAVKNRSFFETKIRITQIIYDQFATVVQATNKNHIFSGITFPDGTDFTTGKISKGENYLGLPYILLDFPRHFKGTEWMAIRTMFWWGKFISCTLLVGGKAHKALQDTVIINLAELSKKRIWVCVHPSPWLHHFGQVNYRMIHHFSGDELSSQIKGSGFVKLARKIPVSGINRSEAFVLESFKLYASLLRQADK